jgi:hypothetical protein
MTLQRYQDILSGREQGGEREVEARRGQTEGKEKEGFGHTDVVTL